MLYWSAAFIVFSIIAGILWLAGVPASATWVAMLLFFVFLGLFFLSLLIALVLHPPAEKIDHRRF